jgi:ornithine cyclodeaminase
MRTLIVSHREVAGLLPMKECIEVMADALRALAIGEASLPLRQVIKLPGSPNLFGLMPGQIGISARDRHRAALGAKVITVFPGNEATPLDSHLGVVLLFEAEMGRLLAIIDASSVTAIRTAAVSGVATKLLANPEAGDLAILGAGVQAMTHLDAMRTVRPGAGLEPIVCPFRAFCREGQAEVRHHRRADAVGGTLRERCRHHLHRHRFT